MPCFRPITVNIRRRSLYSKGTLDEQVVPCGSCLGCKAEQGRQWAVRMMHESRMHPSNLFVTLTLDEHHVETKDGNREVVPKDFSRFIKSLRATQERPLSFFGCGEYGGKSGRPHYHALLFNVEFLDNNRGFDSDRPSVGRSKTLDDLWGRGLCEIGTVTMASASYVAGYIRKKVKDKDRIRCNPLTGELLTPEFSRMSLRPPVGQRWIKEWWRDVYPRDYVVIDGVKAKPPRYYDKFMAFEDEKGGTPERREVMEDVKNQRYLDAIDLSSYTLNAKEALAKSRVELFNRRDTI